jgi:hypothetical protein
VIAFLKVATPMMSFVSMVLVCVGLIPSLLRSKLFLFVSGEVMFVTAIFFGCQAIVGATPFASYGVATWFVIGSIKFGQATFMADQ